MGSESAQNLMLTPNLLSDYVGYRLNLYMLELLWMYFGCDALRSGAVRCDAVQFCGVRRGAAA